jgi:hypothetical protein
MSLDAIRAEIFGHKTPPVFAGGNSESVAQKGKKK